MSRNLSKEKREDLLAKISKLKSFLEKTTATSEMRGYLTELESELKRQKFGLVYEEHKEEIDEILETHTPVLTEDKELFINNGGTINFLIEGDNLAALSLLEKTHKGKIDVIYIDPPYNTGATDWKYNNNYVDSNDLYRHSKWLSMMKTRLRIAKRLLNEKGVLVCSIDHYELFTLGILLNEIFSEDNRLGVVTVVHKPEGRNQEKFFGTSNEFALFYARNKQKVEFNTVVLDDEKALSFTEQDDGGRYRLKNFIRLADGKYATRQAKPNFWYPIYVSPDLSDITLNKETGYTEVYPVIKSGVERTWKTLPKTFLEYINENRIVAKNEEGIITIYEKLYENQVIKTHWIDKKYHAYHFGTKVLDDILGEKMFSFPKSVHQIEDIVKLTLKRSNAVLLDFFAGSGTTGHAVLELNKQDGGNRRFILCTNNENNICREVTYERIKTVITGKRKDGSAYGEPFNASLKYQKIEHLPTNEQLYYDYADELLKHIKELVELENAINFDGNSELAILLTEDEVEEFVSETTKLTAAKSIYLGHDVSLTLTQQKTLRDYDISVNVIPEYYYKEKQI